MTSKKKVAGSMKNTTLLGNQYNEVMNGLSHKVRLALGILVSDHSTMYCTPADVAERILQGYPNMTETMRNEVIKRVGTLLAQMYRQGSSNLFRTPHKITPKVSGRKAQYGYRIGAAMVPLRTTEVRLSEKITADTASSVLEDPVTFLQSIKGQLPLLKLNSLIIELINEMQSRVMKNEIALVELDRRIKKLSEDMQNGVLQPNQPN